MEIKDQKKINKVFVGKIRSVNETDFTLEAVASNESIDRYKEVIRADAYKKRLATYKSHPVLLSSHSYGKLTNQIGMAEKIAVKDGELVAKFKYFVGEGNPEADWAWKLASKFGMAAFSVGFLPWAADGCNYDDDKEMEAVKAGKKPCRTYTDVELLEISQVLVPANATALMKSLEDTSEEIDEVSKEIIKDYGEMILKGIEEDIEGKELEDEVINKPDTAKYIHIPAPGQEGKHSGHTIRTIMVSKKDGIKAHYCVDDKVITGYLFDTEKWTHDEATKWVKDHSKSFEDAEKEFSEIVETYFSNIYEKLIDVKDEEEKEMKELLEKIYALLEEMSKSFPELVATMSEKVETIDKKVGEMYEKGIVPNDPPEDAKEKEDEDAILKMLGELVSNTKEVFRVQSAKD